jgi:hypothetical protein
MSTITDGTSSARMTVASKMIPQRGRSELLDVRSRARRQDEEREHEDERRAGHQLAGPGEPEPNRFARVLRLVVRLSHARRA